MPSPTDVLISKLAKEINAKVDIPGIPEAIEGVAIEGALSIGLRFLPPQYLGWLQSAADGIDDSEADALKAWLTGLMDKYGTSVPAMFHGAIAGVIVNLLRRGVEVVVE